MQKFNSSILSRELLHREFAGVLTLSDFSTLGPNLNRKPAYTAAELFTLSCHHQHQAQPEAK